MPTTETKDFYKLLGAAVRRERKSRGVSQDAVASLLGVTFQQIQKYESGTNRYPIDALVKVAESFGIEASVFFRDLTPGADMTKEDEISAELFLVSRYFRMLPAAQRKAHVYYLKMLSSLQRQAA